MDTAVAATEARWGVRGDATQIEVLRREDSEHSWRRETGTEA